ncbi:MAG: hypothetical protein HY372_03925 [Candidatus Andersenbacteria bacterium]|nr:hypothetical protein [Candidatus Andersenbacteria bacterium]
MGGQAVAVPEAGVWWIAGSGMAGFTVGLWLGVPWRQQLFMAVLLAGVCGLVMVYRGRTMEAARVVVSGELDGSLERPAAGQVADILAKEEPLTPAAAREWLDQLLRQQQS